MKLFLVSSPDKWSYDTYDSMIVAAENEQQARQTHPRKDIIWNSYELKWEGPGKYHFTDTMTRDFHPQSDLGREHLLTFHKLIGY